MNLKWRRLVVTLLAILMIAAAMAEGVGESGEAGHVWQTDIRLSLTRERQLREAAGMDPAAWDAAVDEAKQSGLEASIPREALLEADENAVILEEDGQVYQLGPSSLFGPVPDALSAYRLAYRLVDLLGGSPRTLMYLKSKLTMNDVTVYAFQQVCDAQKVLGGTLKIALDGRDEVTAVFSCIDSNADYVQAFISRQEAESLAAAHCGDNGLDAEVLSEYTDRVFRSPRPMAKAMNMDVDMDPIPDQLVWVVYTPNAGGAAQAEAAETYPFLAHYILVDGTYLLSLPVSQPGDEEARTGYRKQDVFSGLTADTYTGEVTDVNGTARTVTVPVMRSEADGCWYLGDVARRIAVADYFEAAYGENHDIVLVKSDNNADWDKEDIYLFYNYLRAYDFYAEMGWIGPDGEGTDEVIFKGMCYSSGMVYENASSMGKLECWQCFSYAPYNGDGNPTGLGWALDVMAHEYTHAFTETVMNMNLYENDLGAINEAMSDIMGNLVEYIYNDTDDTTWMIAEKTLEPVRRMADPESFCQPASVWGLYYVPTTDKPNTANDWGGVHNDSSLLNLIGAKLCTEYGMSYQDAVSFWVMTAMGLTPRTDYPQMGALLNWALAQTGNSEAYQDALNRLIEETRIDTRALPESLPEGQKIVKLVLPDTETFQNKEWCLYITQMDVKTKAELTSELVDIVKKLVRDPEYRKSVMESAQDILNHVELKESELGVPRLVVTSDDPEEKDPLGALLGELMHKTSAELVKSETALFSWEEQDTGVMPIVVRDMPTVYMLMNISNGGSRMEKLVYLLGDAWYDLTDFMMNDAYNEDETVKEKLTVLAKALGKQALKNLLSSGKGSAVQAESGALPVEYLPVKGLEFIELPEAQQDTKPANEE